MAMGAPCSVLVGLRPGVGIDAGVQDAMDEWVRACGYEPRFTAEAEEAESWLREERDGFAASFLDADMARPQGEVTWRVVRPWVGRRLVLVMREQRRDLWFEALRAGVGTVLSWPPNDATVRAALRAVVMNTGPNENTL